MSQGGNEKRPILQASYPQIGEAVDLRNQFPVGSATRVEMNKIIHFEDPKNAEVYGTAGVYNANAQRAIDDAKALLPSKNGGEPY